MKRMLNATFCAAMLAVAVSSPGAEAAKPAATASLFEDKVIAQGKGVEVRGSQVEEEFSAFKANAAASGKVVPEEQRTEFEKRILDRLITTQLLLQRVTDADKAKAKEAIDKFMENARKQAPSEESFKRQIQALGLTEEKFRARMLERATIEAVYEREVMSKVTISEEQAKKFYDENPDRFKQPEVVRVQHILKMTINPELLRVPNANPELTADEKKKKRAEIEALLKRARDGEDFAKLANENTDDPGTKGKGGEYTFTRGQMALEFEAAAFALSPNQFSEPVTTKYGYHIIKLLEKTPAKTVAFAEVKDRVREGLRVKEGETQMKPYVDKLKAEAEVKVLVERLKL